MGGFKTSLIRMEQPNSPVYIAQKQLIEDVRNVDTEVLDTLHVRYSRPL